MKKIILIMLLSSPLWGMTQQIDSTYYYNSKKILKDYPKSRISAEVFFNAAQKTFEKYGILVPYDIAIAQGILETGLGNFGVGKRDNPFSINSRKGYIRYNSIEEGVAAYYSLMARKYLSCKTRIQLLQNFTNCAGNRYCVGPYEKILRKQINYINRKL